MTTRCGSGTPTRERYSARWRAMHPRSRQWPSLTTGGGSRLVRDDNTVRIWDADTGALQRTLEGHTSSVWSVAFSHDGRRLASGSDDRHGADLGRRHGSATAHAGGPCILRSRQWPSLTTGGGSRLARMTSTVRIWDADTGALQRTLEGHASSVTSVAFSHDGRRLASGSYDQHGADLGRRHGSATAHAGGPCIRGHVSGLLSRRAAARVWLV